MSGKGRIAVTLEAEVYEWIVERAKKDGRTTANFAAHLLTQMVKAEQSTESATSEDDAA